MHEINKEFKNLKYKLYCYAYCMGKNKNKSNYKIKKNLRNCMPKCNEQLIEFLNKKSN